MLIMMNVEELDGETTRMVERIVALRVATKHINLWIRQLEMKRKEMSELAGLMKLGEVRNEVEKEKNLERWARRCTHHFTKKVKKMLFEEIDNMVWSGQSSEISQWCKKNKVYDEVTEAEIEEIWQREGPEEETIRLNGKYVWETAKRVCDYINSHEEIIHITTFRDYRDVMKKVMGVIREAHNVERKRRHTARKKRSDESSRRTQKEKTLIADIRRKEISKEEIERRIEAIFGKGSGQVIGNATTKEKIVERVEELSKREQQFDEWERMRREFKRRQRDDRRLNLFWRRNKTFPAKFGREEETPDPQETLDFWRSINNKEVSEGWKDDRSI